MSVISVCESLRDNVGGKGCIRKCQVEISDAGVEMLQILDSEIQL